MKARLAIGYLLAVSIIAVAGSPPAARGATATATAAGTTGGSTPGTSGWVFSGPRVWFEQATVACPSGVAGPHDGPVRSKAGVTSSDTGAIACPVAAEGNGRGVGAFSGDALPLTLHYTYSDIATATKLTNPPPGAVTTTARVVDPTNLVVGHQGQSVAFFQDLLHGTQVQRADFSNPLAPIPFLELEYRFAIGDFSSNPKAFWPASGPPPPNSFDPVDIRVFESTPGHLEADVTLDTAGVQSITASFAETAAQIAAGIEGADWIEGAQDWTLGADLHLFDMLLTNTDEAVDPAGTPGAFGVRLTDVASVTNVAEPPALLLLGVWVGCLLLLGRGGRLPV